MVNRHPLHSKAFGEQDSYEVSTQHPIFPKELFSWVALVSLIDARIEFWVFCLFQRDTEHPLWFVWITPETDYNKSGDIIFTGILAVFLYLLSVCPTQFPLIEI